MESEGRILRNNDNPINLCDMCSNCEDRFNSLTNCMVICGAPLEILQGHERARNSMERAER